MKRTDEKYQAYVKILEEELVPAMGCTEPIALAYAAAKARETLGCLPDKVEIGASGSIIKNVKSVIVPNTGHLKGIPAAAAAGISSYRFSMRPVARSVPHMMAPFQCSGRISQGRAVPSSSAVISGASSGSSNWTSSPEVTSGSEEDTEEGEVSGVQAHRQRLSSRAEIMIRISGFLSSDTGRTAFAVRAGGNDSCIRTVRRNQFFTA